MLTNTDNHISLEDGPDDFNRPAVSSLDVCFCIVTQPREGATISASMVHTRKGEVRWTAAMCVCVLAGSQWLPWGCWSGWTGLCLSLATFSSKRTTRRFIWRCSMRLVTEYQWGVPFTSSLRHMLCLYLRTSILNAFCFECISAFTLTSIALYAVHYYEYRRMVYLQRSKSRVWNAGHLSPSMATYWKGRDRQHLWKWRSNVGNSVPPGCNSPLKTRSGRDCHLLWVWVDVRVCVRWKGWKWTACHPTFLLSPDLHVSPAAAPPGAPAADQAVWDGALSARRHGAGGCRHAGAPIFRIEMHP